MRMLPNDVLHDLFVSAQTHLEEALFVGINGDAFHNASPEFTWDESAVRSAVTYFRARSACAEGVTVVFDRDGVYLKDYLLMIGRTETDLANGLEDFRAGAVALRGATVTLFNEVN